jgi:ketosteroid isomerase-like protein
MNYFTPEQAEAAFYQAFERADLDGMMAVWARDEQIICVHPGGERLQGFDAVRQSWDQIFSHGPHLRFQLLDARVHTSQSLSFHSVYERITVAGEAGAVHLVLASNVYVLKATGWYMLVHHGSPLAPGAAVLQVATGTVH